MKYKLLIQRIEEKEDGKGEREKYGLREVDYRRFDTIFSADISPDGTIEILNHLYSLAEKEKEKNIENMHKLNGLGEKYENKRRITLFRWIYNKIAKDIEFNNEYC